MPGILQTLFGAFRNNQNNFDELFQCILLANEKQSKGDPYQAEQVQKGYLRYLRDKKSNLYRFIPIFGDLDSQGKVEIDKERDLYKHATFIGMKVEDVDLFIDYFARTGHIKIKDSGLIEATYELKSFYAAYMNV